MAFQTNDGEFDEFLGEEIDGGEPQPPKKSGKGNFALVAGLIGGLMLIGLVVLVVLATVIVPQQNARRAEQAAQIYAANTATSIAATSAAATQFFLMTPSATPLPPATNTPTITAVVAMASATAELSESDMNATVTAQIATQLAGLGPTMEAGGGGGGSVTGTPGALPETGVGDHFNFPFLAGMGLILLTVIFIVRRMRTSGSA